MNEPSGIDRRQMLMAMGAASALPAVTGCATSAEAATTAQPLPSGNWLLDVHHHFIPPVYLRALQDAGLDKAGGVPFPTWDIPSTLEFMDGAQIKHAFTSISTPGVNFGDDAAARALARTVNEEAARMMADYPDRFGGFACLPLPDAEGALKELEYALDTLKLDGVVLLTSQFDGTYLGDPKYEELMAELNRRKAVVFVHPTVPVTSQDIKIDIPGFIGEFVFDTTRAIFNLIWNGTAERCPDIKFIFSHAGGTAPYLTWRGESMDRYTDRKEKNYPKGTLAYLQQFNYDLALSTSPYAVSSILELVPKSKLFFGSDFCFARPERVAIVKQMFDESPFLSDEDRLLIGQTNVQRMFPRLA